MEEGKEVALEDLEENFAKRFTEFLKVLDVPQGEVAIGLSVSNVAITKFKQGKMFPSITTLFLMNLVFSISIDWFLSGKGEMIIDNNIFSDTQRIMRENCGKV